MFWVSQKSIPLQFSFHFHKNRRWMLRLQLSQYLNVDYKFYGHALKAPKLLRVWNYSVGSSVSRAIIKLCLWDFDLQTRKQYARYFVLRNSDFRVVWWKTLLSLTSSHTRSIREWQIHLKWSVFQEWRYLLMNTLKKELLASV